MQIYENLDSAANRQRVERKGIIIQMAASVIT